MLRFDYTASQRQQKSDDKFTPICILFEKWAELLPDYMNPHEYITIDEQLIPFRGRCKFRQYMPMKPAKYGLKFWLCMCAETGYFYNI